jgi:hypothetical protein
MATSVEVFLVPSECDARRLHGTEKSDLLNAVAHAVMPVLGVVVG